MQATGLAAMADYAYANLLTKSGQHNFAFSTTKAAAIFGSSSVRMPGVTRVDVYGPDEKPVVSFLPDHTHSVVWEVSTEAKGWKAVYTCHLGKDCTITP